MTKKTQQEQELTIARRIVREALAKGWLVSVSDGGEWTVKRSTKERTITGALQSTDCDTIRFRDKAGGHVGDVFFVWGNGEDVLTDYSAKLDAHNLQSLATE